MRIERDVGVAMRDGTRLAADVFRPDDDRPHPVLMQRTPYGRTMPLYLHATGIDVLAAVERGYAVVSQDCRGRFGSEGEWRPFRHEADDGYDTVEWAAGQPWCDGRVGIWGCSYMGNTALQAAVAAPPHLTAVMSYMGGPRPHQGWAYTGGAFELGFASFWTTRGAWETLRRSDLGDEARAALTAELRAATERPTAVIGRLPVAEADGTRPELVPFWREWLEHPELDAWWLEVDVPARADAIAVPVLHITGVHDNFLGGHLALEAALRAHPSAEVRDAHRFVLGPWDHESYQTSRPAASGQVDFGPEARNGFALNDALSRDWFDFWMLGEDTPLTRTPRVRHFRTGTGEWRHEDVWPPPHQELALHPAPGGALLAAPAAGDSSDTYRYDPRDPTPSVGGRTLSPVYHPPGVQDQAAREARADVVSYTTEPLDGPVVAAGEARVELRAASSCEDTDFTATLVDVEPDGYCRNVAEGIVRARHRDGAERLLVPGEPARLTIDLMAVTHAFRPGHRIRLDVASAAYPHFSRNLNAAVRPELGGEADIRVAEQTVFHCGTRLVLPVVPHNETRVPNLDSVGS